MKTYNDTLNIKNIFDKISFYYDFVNNCISLGFHYFVKLKSVNTLRPHNNSKVLDLCCGTGDITKIINSASKDIQVIGVDFSENMLNFAKKKNPNNIFIDADCTYLPFDDNEFDYITISFGFRNIIDKDKALKEMNRVLKPGGKLLHLDVGHHNLAFKVFCCIIPIAISILKKDKESYLYFKNSICNFKEPKEVIKNFELYSFKNISVKNYMFGAITAEVFEKV